ncbi:hypothetical protein [Plantactinospora sp. KBS50]|uniref:hypothetical protein n=1 Tax=Plantactinospora sp. KBS50 TaxID=2024580 RepID=UPI000BAACD85|nr:hypothetical protein [Plantactinospora sp. KBS50]ASW54510.1 hypothetical protein CIK06_10400 [Plantactinospora sp. KBS50]
MCGSVSAVGLEEDERRTWPYLRERLRVPGHLMALMRGVLGDVEVAAVVAVTPQGVVRPQAILATPEPIRQEIILGDEPDEADDTDGHPLRAARIGDDEVQVITEPGPDGRARPLAVLATPWIDQHLLLYARTLWHRRR